MTNEEIRKNCAREECGKEFILKTHNMKYCTDECCRLATNSRIMVGYYKTRDRLVLGIERFCEVCDNTKLSRYNESDVCAACKAKRTAKSNNDVVTMLRNASLV